MASLSNSQFGANNSMTPQTPDVDTPLSFSSSTAGSAAQATAWKNRNIGGGRPLALSKRTMGTTFNWDDTSTNTSVTPTMGGRNPNA
jgi:hypothetical protein